MSPFFPVVNMKLVLTILRKQIGRVLISCIFYDKDEICMYLIV